MSKSKEDQSLVWIDKPAVDEGGKSNALSVAIKVLDMYKSDFNLTIKEISDILLCERKWVYKYVKDNVKHIFLNQKFRAFLNSLDISDLECILKDYYYFSRSDFYRWLSENTKITRQTIRINLLDYSNDPSKIAELKGKFKGNNVSIKNSKKEFEEEYKSQFYSMLSIKGRIAMSNIVSLTQRKALEIDVTYKEKLPSKFTTIKSLKGDKSIELAYRRLYLFGALKYTIVDSLVRYDQEYADKDRFLEQGEIVTIPYEVYLKIL